jgi:hypothetical protein
MDNNHSQEEMKKKILGFKMNTLKSLCFERKLKRTGDKKTLAQRLIDDGYTVVNETGSILPFSPSVFVEKQFTSQLDSQRFMKNLKHCLQHNQKTGKYFTFSMDYSLDSYNHFFEKSLTSGKVKTRRNYKKQQINGWWKGKNRVIHRTYQATSSLLQSHDFKVENGFLKLDFLNTNYWHFSYVSNSLWKEDETFKICLLQLKTSFNIEREKISVTGYFTCGCLDEDGKTWIAVS